MYAYMYECANIQCDWMWAMQYAHVYEVHEVWSVVDCAYSTLSSLTEEP